MADPLQNEKFAVAPAPTTCPVRMRDEKPCGRPSLGPLLDGVPYCLMHTPTGKDEVAFQREFERILDGAGIDVADFTRFVFPTANYAKREFKASCVFFGARFTSAAYFWQTRFEQGADFSEATFQQDAFLAKAKFEQQAAFGRATFVQNCYLGGATFEQEADFSRATFGQEAGFSQATFVQKAAFPMARFARNANFSKATFAVALFNWATFEQEADFSQATFAQAAEFLEATFTQADFSRAVFARTAYFQEAKFIGGARFRETRFRQDKECLPGPTFSLAEFCRPEMIVFYKTYLGQALFQNCDVSKLTFSSVEWRRRNSWGQCTGKRMVFEEEVDLEAVDLGPPKGTANERDYGLIAELYQQLKKSYDESKDYWTAGDFHYGEMEMKRLHSRSENKLVRWIHRNFGMVAWYKYASAYGESYVRPLIMLLIVVAIFTSIFPLAGLNSDGGAPHSALTVATGQVSAASGAVELDYRHYADFVYAYPGGQWVGRAAFFGHSLMTTVSLASFQRELKYEPSYPWGRALALLELLLTSTLIALFFLALRRQFKR